MESFRPNQYLIYIKSNARRIEPSGKPSTKPDCIQNFFDSTVRQNRFREGISRLIGQEMDPDAEPIIHGSLRTADQFRQDLVYGHHRLTGYQYEQHEWCCWETVNLPEAKSIVDYLRENRRRIAEDL